MRLPFMSNKQEKSWHDEDRVATIKKKHELASMTRVLNRWKLLIRLQNWGVSLPGA